MEAGGSQLVLIKTVRNETQGTAEGQSNQAHPGDVLVYRITIINPSQRDATDVIIYDRTPPYSALAEAVPSPVTLTPTLNCTVAQPTVNAAGYAGALQWDCTGVHQPGGEGSVTFKARITP